MGVYGWRIVASKSKQVVVEYRLPEDQVATGDSVYIDILDSTGTPTGDPTEMTRVGSTDIVKATITAPSTVGKYELEIWTGTWDGTTRTKTETINYLGLEVVDKDIEDTVADIETKVDNLQTDINTIKDDLTTIKKWLRRHPA